MAVKLSSLRVDATLDAGGYTRGAAQKTDADARMIAADKAFAASQAQIALALIATGNRLGAYSDALNDNQRALAQSTAQNVEAGRGFAMTGIEVANTANHLKTAAIAAYALSPAFRGLVNPAITASFRAMGPAAVAAGGAALSAFSPLLVTLGRLALPIGIAVESFRAMNAITELGAEKIKEFGELAAKAGAAQVGTDFFQRQAAGAKAFGIEANLATEALKKFNEVSREQLGGSVFNQRLDQLTKAGNFQGNPGVAALQQATDTQSRYRAVVDLITVAADQGQRLAALDLASKFLPPELLERLRTSGSTLKDLQATADAIKPADIVGPEEIGYALELKRRLDDANEVIANKFKPVQKDLTQLGLNYQESWVNITEIMAGAVTKGNDLYSALKGIPGLFAQAGNASFWTKLTEWSERQGWNSTPESMGLTLKGAPGYNDDDTARKELGAGLRNPNATRQAMLQATAIQTAVRGDTSINPSSTVKAVDDVNDAVDRALLTLSRHTEQQIADTNAMGLGVGALARFRAEAAQTSAVQANGGKITADQAMQFEILKKRAEDAAIALEKAKVANEINFGRQTALLSPEDVQIAQKLKGLYPDVAEALGASDAVAVKPANALSSRKAKSETENGSDDERVQHSPAKAA
jgi:hypothetical protein